MNIVVTIRKIGVTVGDAAGALRQAGYSLELADSPEAFRRSGGPEDAGPGDAGSKSNAMWVGTPRALARLGLELGAEVLPEQLAAALQGRHIETGEQVRKPGKRFAKVGSMDGGGHAAGTCTIAVPSVNSVDLTFSAPKSVSVVWSQAGPELRAGIEQAMLSAATAVLQYMTETKPVLQGTRLPANGFAASVALHVTARRARDERVP